MAGSGGLGEVRVGELARPHGQADERRHAGAHTLGLVGLPHPTERAVRRLGVVRQGPGRRWLVGDEGRHVVGVQRHPGEPRHRTTAAAEHVDRAATEVLDQGVQVGGLVLGPLVEAIVTSHAAATEAARVVGHHRAVGELGRQVGEAVGLHRLADHQQQRAAVGSRDRSAHVVGEVDVGQLEGLGLRGHGGLLVWVMPVPRSAADGFDIRWWATCRTAQQPRTHRRQRHTR